MKKIHGLIVGLGIVLAASATFASPAPVDPSVIINKTGPGDLVTFSSNSVTDPLVIDLVNGLAPLQTFEYTGSGTLTVLYVALDNALPEEVFTCQSNIFTGCEGAFNAGQNNVGLIFGPGSLTSAEYFTAEVSAPEPRSWMLLLCSMLGLLFVGRFCWEPNRGY